ncbi:MAG: histidine phosphatase family protein [Chloroflexota bacterium]
MKTLLILRHAKSSWSDASLSDHERPLNKRGRRDAPKMGTLLAHEQLTPDIIITSSARRALDTAEAVAAESGYGGSLIVSRALYHAEPDDYLAEARENGGAHEIVMIVGHNPGIEDLVEQLTGEWHRMPTAALAEVRLAIEEWSSLEDDATGRLEDLWLPRDLPD